MRKWAGPDVRTLRSNIACTYGNGRSVGWSRYTGPLPFPLPPSKVPGQQVEWTQPNSEAITWSCSSSCSNSFWVQLLSVQSDNFSTVLSWGAGRICMMMWPGHPPSFVSNSDPGFAEYWVNAYPPPPGVYYNKAPTQITKQLRGYSGKFILPANSYLIQALPCKSFINHCVTLIWV